VDYVSRISPWAAEGCRNRTVEGVTEDAERGLAVPRLIAAIFAVLVGIFAAKPLFNLISISFVLPPWPFSWSVPPPTSGPGERHPPRPNLGPNIQERNGPRTLKGILTGPIVLIEDTVIEGVVNGDVIVNGGVSVEVRGTVAGDLHVKSRAKVIIYGIVTGTVRNEGGSVAIHGTAGNVN
jgi:hypothetical protein